ncbi:unnamed protein product [Arabis nemorensis]|uniref:Uncharacterized protein n=1 Tax=Arabis nemorensis TaxID=586526 RepID=A0A565CNN4_9BRAS|nr:unnamed protein product [Arabis nemorensis]
MGDNALTDNKELMSTGDPPASRAISKCLAAGDASRHPSKPIRKKGPGSFSRDDLLAVTDHSDTLMELNQKFFPLDSDDYSKLGYNTVFNESTRSTNLSRLTFRIRLLQQELRSNSCYIKCNVKRIGHAGRQLEGASRLAGRWCPSLKGKSQRLVSYQGIDGLSRGDDSRSSTRGEGTAGLS